MPNPPFSVVIPVYNREKLVGRALRSCVAQTFRDFEIVVVDDCSTDRTLDEVNAIADERISVIRHEKNRGVCPAQNTGTAAARGAWVVYLHSDDELLPEALEKIHRRTQSAADDVYSLRFNFQCTSGKISPEPALGDQVLDYEGYIQWMASVTGSADNVLCIRRSTFPTVQFPDSRAFEVLYMLDFARRYKVQCCSDVVSIKHYDAPNQLTHDVYTANLKYAPDHASAMDMVFRRHGEALARCSQRVHHHYQRVAAINHLQAGNRSRGTKYALRYLVSHPGSTSVWMSLCLGWVSPKLLMHVRKMKAA